MMPEWKPGDMIKSNLNIPGVITSGKLYEVAAVYEELTFIKKNDRGRNYQPGVPRNGFLHKRFKKVEEANPCNEIELIRYYAKIDCINKNWAWGDEKEEHEEKVYAFFSKLDNEFPGWDYEEDES